MFNGLKHSETSSFTLFWPFILYKEGFKVVVSLDASKTKEFSPGQGLNRLWCFHQEKFASAECEQIGLSYGDWGRIYPSAGRHVTHVKYVFPTTCLISSLSPSRCSSLSLSDTFTFSVKLKLYVSVALRSVLLERKRYSNLQIEVTCCLESPPPSDSDWRFTFLLPTPQLSRLRWISLGEASTRCHVTINNDVW